MKKYIRLISILLILWITGCNKFLDVTPKNVISMDDLQSIKQALSGFLNGMRVDGGNSYNFENPVSPLEPSNREGVLLAYCEEWDLSELAADNEGMTVEDIKKVDWRDETTQGYWGRFYQTIGFMNLILHEAETATGDEDMRDYIMGEAYVMRAYCFFKLVQYYAPYDNNDLGIPLCLNSYDDFEDVNLSRAPQTKVYAQILPPYVPVGNNDTWLSYYDAETNFSCQYPTNWRKITGAKGLTPSAEPPLLRLVNGANQLTVTALTYDTQKEFEHIKKLSLTLPRNAQGEPAEDYKQSNVNINGLSMTRTTNPLHIGAPDEPGEDIQQIVLHYFQESKKRTFTIVMLIYDEEAETDLNAITSSIQITQ